MYYKIIDRQNNGDYGGIDLDAIQGVAYSPDTKTAIIKTDMAVEETERILPSAEAEFNALQAEYLEHMKTIQMIPAVKSESEIDLLMLAVAELYEKMEV